jgi:type IV pilus assembly protein PilC
MPLFSYTGTDSEGKTAAGKIEASTEAEVRSLLRKERIRVSELKIKQNKPVLKLGGGVKLKDLSSFSRQFASMNSSGISIVPSLDAIAEQTENKTLRAVVAKISFDVQSGLSLAAALALHPHIFNRLYCSMVRAGEAAGILSDVLLRLADYQEKAVAVRRRVKGAFAYPILVGSVAVGALIALMTYVVPTFSSMLSELGATLPLSTRLVIAASNFAQVWVLPSILIIGAGIFGFIYLYKWNERFGLLVDAMLLKIPLFGDLQRKSGVARFSRTFGALLSGGVPIADALEITSTTAGNRILERGFLKALEAIRMGKPLAQPLKETGLFPPMVVQMVLVGEKSGNLPAMLTKISDYYDGEIDGAISTLTSILEPAIIVVMGIFIAGVLISMYLPMFEMVNSIG